MKISGAEFNEWYTDHWPGKDWYIDDFDDEIFDADGNVADLTKYYDGYSLGVICWQGNGEDPTHGEINRVEDVIKKWRKERDTFSVLVRGKKDLEAKTLDILKGIGVSVRKL